MSLDVVIVTFNSAEQLPICLQSLPGDARVIVVDNASADDSVSVARDLGAEVIENPVNAGFGAAANQGVSRGAADTVLLLNPDARVDGSTLERLAERLHADPEVAVVSPRLRTPDGGEQRVLWPVPSAAGAWQEALGLHRLLRIGDQPGFVIGACFMVRRDAFESLGGFDERFWLYGEETDLCKRLGALRLRCELMDDLWADHVGGASGGGVEGLVFEHFQRGGEHNVAKHEGAGALVSYRLANLVGSTARSLLPGRERSRLHRTRARRLVRMLWTRPTSVPLDSSATRARGEGLVVCSLEAWDEVWRRNQLLVRELLARDPNRRVLFVEPPFDRVHEARHPSGRTRRRGIRPLDADGRVVRLEPHKVWPRVLGGLADRSLRRQVRKAVRELGFVEPVLWVNDPHYAGLASETGWSALYDITDDWTEAGDGDRATRRVRRAESLLFEECQAVVVCSEGLASSRRVARPDLQVVPNAVDLPHFQRSRARPDDLPGSPVAVYVGTLHEDRLDVGLVCRLADSAPWLAVTLVGPISLGGASLEQLSRYSNVRILGSRPYDEVPTYLQHADVVIVPHVISPFTESLDPIKAYECLAVGRPTVATPVAGFRDLGAPIRCEPGASFVGAVREVVADGPHASEPRAVPTWSERAAAFDRALSSTGSERRRLRVVFVDHCAKLSGAELALGRLLPALGEQGVDAHVILGERGPLEGLLRDAGATVEVLALDERVGETSRTEVRLGAVGVGRTLAAMRDISRLRRRLLELQPDLVHTNSLKAALYGGVAGRLAGVPVVWHIRDRIASDYLPRPAVGLVRMLGWLLPRAIIANSQSTRATLGVLHNAGVIPSPVVYDAQHDDSFAHLGPARVRSFRVAVVGRLAPWKGQDVFLRAFADAFRNGTEHAFVVGSAMFGEEHFAEELHALAEQLEIGEQVEFTGFVNDVPELLARVDCLVHCSVIPEPFGQVVVEGMAAGLPVIASAEGGPAEIITDEVDGLLCPPGDVGALADLLIRLAAAPLERQRLGQAGRLRARDFRPEVIASKVMEVYEAVSTRR